MCPLLQVLPAWEGSSLSDTLTARQLKRQQLHLLHDGALNKFLDYGEWSVGTAGALDMGLPVKTAATRNSSYYSYSSRWVDGAESSNVGRPTWQSALVCCSCRKAGPNCMST